MKAETLQALLIDRELGELPAETVELLEAWLSEHPESAAVVPALRRTLKTTGAAVRRFPELGRPETNVIALSSGRVRWAPLAMAASVAVLLAGAAWLGFRVSRESAEPALTVAGNRTAPAAGEAGQRVKADGPWARYALVADPRGGVTVARR